MLLMAFVEEGNEQAKVKRISCKKVVRQWGFGLLVGGRESWRSEFVQGICREYVSCGGEERLGLVHWCCVRGR